MKEVRILSRIVRWRPGEGVTIETYLRRVGIAIVDAGTGNAKTLSFTGEKSEVKADLNDQDDSEGELLNPARASAYRSVVARMNYLNIDRSDIACAVKELARKMCKPNVDDEIRVSNLARYPKGRPRAV